MVVPHIQKEKRKNRFGGKIMFPVSHIKDEVYFT